MARLAVNTIKERKGKKNKRAGVSKETLKNGFGDGRERERKSETAREQRARERKDQNTKANKIANKMARTEPHTNKKGNGRAKSKRSMQSMCCTKPRSTLSSTHWELVFKKFLVASTHKKRKTNRQRERGRPLKNTYQKDAVL